MSTIFLSHRILDAALAELLAHGLEAAGHKVWFVNKYKWVNQLFTRR